MMKKIFLIAIGMIAVLALASCGNGTEKATEQTTTQPAQITVNCAVTEFSLIENADKLAEDIKNGTIPSECNVLYDEMGARPEIILTNPEQIKEIYNLLSDITVTGKSDMSITDCYHHVVFKLQDGTFVRFNFEGTELLSLDRENYEVSGGQELWSLIRLMQEEIMEE